MRIHSVLVLVSVLGASCNLFTPTATPGPDAAASTDLSVPDAEVRDVSGADATSPSDMNADATTRPDVCVPESDAELCAAAGAGCGELLLGGGAMQEVEAEDVAQNDCGPSDGYAVFCNSTTTATLEISVAADATYRVGILARAEVFGEIPAKAELSVGGIVLAVIPVYGGAAAEYSTLVQLPAGTTQLQWRFANDAFVDGQDRNLEIDVLRATGPLQELRDGCGQPRSPDCGTCAVGTCSLQRPNECACACPLADGSCAPLGPHPTSPCLRCDEAGWTGVTATCDTGDLCTTGQCHVPSGLCRPSPIACPAGTCESPTCAGGVCGVTTAPDGSACGTGGICTAGACGCPDGTMTETACGGNVDDDCDGLLNCADPDCDGMGCGGNRTCVAGVCQN